MSEPAALSPTVVEIESMKAFATVFLGAALISGCAAPATRISTGLQRYGLDAGRADCLGKRLEGDLSLGQLQQLGRAANAYGKDDPSPGVLTIGDLVRVSGELTDPAIPLAVGKAAAGCGVLP